MLAWELGLGVGAGSTMAQRAKMFGRLFRGAGSDWSLECRDEEWKAMPVGGIGKLALRKALNGEIRNSPLDFPQEVCIRGQCLGYNVELNEAFSQAYSAQS